MSPIDRTDFTRSGCKVGPRVLTPYRCPVSAELLAEINVEVARKAQDITKDMVSNDVRVEAPHIGQGTGMSDQFRKDVMF